MKKNSITARITLWYGAFLILISAALIIALVSFITMNAHHETETMLVQVVEDVSDEISSDGEEFIYDDGINYYVKDVYISVYDEKFELVTGRRPKGFDAFPPLLLEETHDAKDASGEDWCIYDTKIFMDDGQDLYIRGMMDSRGIQNNFGYLKYFFLLVPVLMLLAIIGGWIMSRKALTPIRDLLNVTKDITDDGDFTRRLEVPKTADETESLAYAFNGMFDRIEEVLNREKQFSSDVSHELRTPLAVISTQSEYALEDPEYSEKALKKINKEAHRMSSLVSSLLALSRSESGRLNPVIQSIDLDELLDSIAEEAGARAKDKGTTITYIKEDEGKIIAESDEEYLMRCVINLLDNAIQYGKQENGRIELRLNKDDKYAVITVADDGDGIPADEREAVWTRFYQTDASRSREGSSGLGLSMVESLIKALGGSAKYINEEDRREGELEGAVFELRIPLKV